jgi:nucleoside-diphosphate-sugar epimerase
VRDLITGGAGFIGSHLVDRLVARGDQVTVLDDLSTGNRNNLGGLLADGRPRLVVGTTDDAELVEELMAGADRCFHLASSVGVKLIVEQPLDCVLRSTRGTDTVMGAAARHDVRLLFTSTSEVYGKQNGRPLREEDDRLVGPPTTSRWSYMTAKTFGEVLAYGYTRERGAEMTVARLFNAVGPRQASAYGMVLPRFVRQALAGEDLTVYGDGTQSRCFTHVDDVIEALVAIMESDGAIGNVYNVGSSAPVTILELARRVIARTGSSSSLRMVPYEEAYGNGFEELGSRRPDCSALERLVGWRPRRSLDDAIDDAIAAERELPASLRKGRLSVNGAAPRNGSANGRELITSAGRA